MVMLEGLKRDAYFLGKAIRNTNLVEITEHTKKINNKMNILLHVEGIDIDYYNNIIKKCIHCGMNNRRIV